MLLTVLQYLCSVDNNGTKSITVRFRKDLSDYMDKVIVKTTIYNNKPELILGAIRNGYIGFIDDPSIVTDKEVFCKNMATALFYLEGGKNYYQSFNGIWCQTIVRIPINLYDRLKELLLFIPLSVQDFIKGSIIRELKRLDFYSDTYTLLKSTFEGECDIEERKNQIIQIGLEISERGLIDTVTGKPFPSIREHTEKN